MSDRMSDELLDARLSAFLAQRAEEIAAQAPQTEVVAVHVADRVSASRGWLTRWRILPSAARLGFGLALLLLALLAYGIVASRLPARPLTNGPIAFVDGADIVIVGADGTGQHTLAAVQAADVGAACCLVVYSPDGSRLLAVTGSSIEVMNADGTGRTEVLRGVRLGLPVWSPDGRRIAVSAAVQGFTQILVVDIDGGSPKSVSSGLLYAVGPAWSHDGRWIAFGGARSSMTQQALFVVAADGTGLRQVGPAMPPGSSVASVRPAWSPDDRSIALDVGSFTDRQWVIDTVAADGTGFRTLLPDGLQGFVPVWSPDGSWIAFAGWRTGGQAADLYVIRPDGGGARRLAVDVSWFDHPWSPDGKLIAFAHGLAGTTGTIDSPADVSLAANMRYADLRAIRPDGSGERIVATRRVTGAIAWPADWR